MTSHSSFRNLTLLAFFAACLTFLGYLYAQAGGSLPGLGGRDYTVSFDTETLNNLVEYADVQIAGVPVGKVGRLERMSPDRIRVPLRMDEVATPLHQGVTAQISEKSLAGQPVVVLVDGTGPALPDGTVLPAASVKDSVQLRDVLASLDKPTRDSLGGVIRSLGQSTDGRRDDIAALADGLSGFGGGGATALRAVAEQSSDLEAISQQLNQVFDSLDVGRGQIVDLVSTADRLSSATARQRPALEASMRKLPAVLTSATQASDGVSRIAHSLSPVAADLHRAAPDLNDALDQLPETSSDLRGLMPSLHAVLDHAPDTLDRVPDFGHEAREFFPPATGVLRDLNPALRYLKPYGLDIAQFFANFGAAVTHYGDDGEAWVYVRPHVSAISARPSPVVLPQSLFPSNPYPAPGGMVDLKPFVGKYPRLERDGE
ncbi:MlaD family protein [Pseudonocardia spinosispora]|uniref:MlaD family protein n=1 Tax=Pseudonocardia spinosispora TaxID=103441 RepID=UPI000491F394|nr:MlaD family protein [Pseudonocardia spinosispora]